MGTTGLNVPTADQVITITNNGAADLNYLAMGLVGTDATSFLMSTAKPTAGTKLAPGGTMTVSVYCQPTAYPKGVPPPEGTKVTLSAAVRWLFDARAAFEVPITCDLSAPGSTTSSTTTTTTTQTTTTTDNTLVASPPPPPPGTSSWLALGHRAVLCGRAGSSRQPLGHPDGRGCSASR